MLAATATYSTPAHWLRALGSREIRYSVVLSLATCTTTALLALLLAVPVGYLLARGRFFGKAILDAALDIPIVLPPMVVGLCLLILFQTPFGRVVERVVPFTYTVAGVVLAQFVIGSAFAVRTMRGTFDHLSSRPEDVAMTLGCSRGRAVWLVTLPAARRGMFAAASIAWARSLASSVRFRLRRRDPDEIEVPPHDRVAGVECGQPRSRRGGQPVMVALAMLVLVAVRWRGRGYEIEIRNPKSERIRRPKSSAARNRPLGSWEFWICLGFRISDFGFPLAA